MVGVGKMIATIRKDRNMSQQELANKIGATKQTISNYERGVREPDYYTLEAIADILNVPVSMLISREEQAKALDAIYGTYEKRYIIKKQTDEKYVIAIKAEDNPEPAPSENDKDSVLNEHVLSRDEWMLIKAFRAADSKGRFRIIQMCINELDAAEARLVQQDGQVSS